MVFLEHGKYRSTIFEIQLGKRNLEPRDFDLAKLSEATNGFSGAEIEQAVVASLYSALAKGQSALQQVKASGSAGRQA